MTWLPATMAPGGGSAKEVSPKNADAKLGRAPGASVCACTYHAESGRVGYVPGSMSSGLGGAAAEWLHHTTAPTVAATRAMTTAAAPASRPVRRFGQRWGLSAQGSSGSSSLQYGRCSLSSQNCHPPG